MMNYFFVENKLYKMTRFKYYYVKYIKPIVAIVLVATLLWGCSEYSISKVLEVSAIIGIIYAVLYWGGYYRMIDKKKRK